MIAGIALFDAARPGDVGFDSLQLCVAEEIGIAFVAQHCQAGFFMQDFAAKWIDHTYVPIAHCLYNWLIKSTTFDQLADQHALINQRDVEISGHKTTIAVLDFAWVCDDTFQPLRLEILGKHHELAVTWHLFPVENGDTWRFTSAYPLLVGVYQGIQDAVTRGRIAHFIVMQKLAHYR